MPGMFIFCEVVSIFVIYSFFDIVWTDFLEKTWDKGDVYLLEMSSLVLRSAIEWLGHYYSVLL